MLNLFHEFSEKVISNQISERMSQTVFDKTNKRRSLLDILLQENINSAVIYYQRQIFKMKLILLCLLYMKLLL